MQWARKTFSRDELVEFLTTKGSRLPPRERAYWSAGLWSRSTRGARRWTRRLGRTMTTGITDAQVAALGVLGRFAGPAAYLAGGVGVALRMGHRLSRDLDLFAPEVDAERLAEEAVTGGSGAKYPVSCGGNTVSGHRRSPRQHPAVLLPIARGAGTNHGGPGQGGRLARSGVYEALGTGRPWRTA